MKTDACCSAGNIVKKELRLEAIAETSGQEFVKGYHPFLEIVPSRLKRSCRMGPFEELVDSVLLNVDSSLEELEQVIGPTSASDIGAFTARLE